MGYRAGVCVAYNLTGVARDSHDRRAEPSPLTSYMRTLMRLAYIEGVVKLDRLGPAHAQFKIVEDRHGKRHIVDQETVVSPADDDAVLAAAITEPRIERNKISYWSMTKLVEELYQPMAVRE